MGQERIDLIVGSRLRSRQVGLDLVVPLGVDVVPVTSLHVHACAHDRLAGRLGLSCGDRCW